MELDDWYPVPTGREDVGSIAVAESPPPSDEEWPPLPALVPVTHSDVPPGWRVDRDAPGRLRYWDGQDWTQYATPRATPRAVPSLKRGWAADHRAKALLTAVGAVVLLVALIAVMLPRNKSSSEPPTTRVTRTTTPAPTATR